MDVDRWRSRDAHFGILVELVRGDEVNGEDNFDTVLLGLLDKSSDFLRTCLIKEGVTNL